MNNRIPVVLILLLPSIFAEMAVADPWTVSVDAGLTLTQNAYTNNWVGGEAGSATWMFLSNSLAEKQINPYMNTKNVLKLQFGQTYTQDQDTKNWNDPEKSSDLIDFESVFRFDFNTWVDPFASARIESQFQDKSDKTKTVAFNPVILTQSVGAARVLIKEDTRDWTIRLGAGIREFIDRQQLDPVTGSRSTDTSADGGIEFVSDLRTPLAGGRLNLKSKLIVFQALFYSKSEKLRKNPRGGDWRTADVNWENVLTVSITRYLMVNLYTQFLYDKQISRAGRFKQTLGLGVTWKYE
ncbi:DUF3078 domain-containing protein, partial [Candidatus Latescibacterota bacterium]